MNYNFNVFKMDLDNLISTYPFLDTFSIGKSVLGNDLYCIRLGKREKTSFL